MSKPNYPHFQSQSPSPSNYSQPSAEVNLQNVDDLRNYVDNRFSSHIHNGTESPRINANTDIIGSLGATVYFGSVALGGTANTPFPNGWSVGTSGTGFYQITHNLLTTNFIVLATMIGVAGTIRVNTTSSTQFEIAITNTSASSVNSAFYFILIPG